MFHHHFKILCFNDGILLESLVSVITQDMDMVLVSQAQLFEGEVVDVVVNNNIIKVIGNLEGIIKTSGSNIIDRDRHLDFTGGLACNSGDSSKVDIFIEITGSIIEWRWDKGVANFHGEDVDWIFS